MNREFIRDDSNAGHSWPAVSSIESSVRAWSFQAPEDPPIAVPVAPLFSVPVATSFLAATPTETNDVDGAGWRRHRVRPCVPSREDRSRPEARRSRFARS